MDEGCSPADGQVQGHLRCADWRSTSLHASGCCVSPSLRSTHAQDQLKSQNSK